MPFEISLQVPGEKARPLPEEQTGRPLRGYLNPAQEARAHLAQEISDLDAEIQGLERRLHDINEMPILGKLGALLEGRDISQRLEELYKKRTLRKSQLH